MAQIRPTVQPDNGHSHDQPAIRKLNNIRQNPESGEKIIGNQYVMPLPSPTLFTNQTEGECFGAH